MRKIAFLPVEWSELEPWREAAKKEHSGIDPLPSIKWFGAFLVTADPIGCIGLLHVSDETVRVRGWYMTPEWRGLGYGMALQERANEWARAKGYGRIESTTRLWRVLERHGWYVIEHYSPGVGTKMGLQL